jgi:hypothetical protein
VSTPDLETQRDFNRTGAIYNDPTAELVAARQRTVIATND